MSPRPKECRPRCMFNTYSIHANNLDVKAMINYLPYLRCIILPIHPFFHIFVSFFLIAAQKTTLSLWSYSIKYTIDSSYVSLTWPDASFFYRTPTLAVLCIPLSWVTCVVLNLNCGMWYCWNTFRRAISLSKMLPGAPSSAFFMLQSAYVPPGAVTRHIYVWIVSCIWQN